MNVFRRLMTEPVRARTWRETGYLLLGPLVAAACVVVVLAAFYAAIASITVIGLAALAAVVSSARGIGAIERLRARRILGLTIAMPPARARTRAGLTGWVRDALADRTSWLCLLYAVTSVPFGIAQAYVVSLWWALSLLMAAYPAWYLIPPLRDGHHFDAIQLTSSWRWHPDQWPHPLLVSVIGIAGVLAAPWLVHGFTSLDRWRLRILTLGSHHDDQVRTLQRRRDNAVEQAGAHLRRIERDLHDGAQVRMVALAMELGRAREELEQGADPRQAAIRVAAAHDEAKQALVELRELARGIYPAVLTDTGLTGAIPVLTARCPIPVSADITLDSRPPAAVEATAYFCVGELLANLCKHSAATAGWVRIGRSATRLRVQVGDNGVGGAAPNPTGGLAGLTDRVDSIGGTIAISSPVNGPTLITVELPCG
ncbi:signal transduction histidine kinase [Hamadaea flava]|uniref:histidine kinase n=1 Tax=Hamadaea flava TaxID=1742688 RepID=A0ABV8LNZ6_9ACTN|nr:sensor domain-containing protein [Hamadaea flava]MCP2323961.1 signal transduction histidine kinase [Hamadaea flava]